ncbi:DNA polymerase III subunit chi [Croceicoccus sp. F390]|uniref:DNA polymerase III subunit chi n=1 Tax=Croceicoccus esteveae TaxID=3075597 RepID=A0ABU2ZDZ6_9SPHN|nr:DNA polymerase III subunit chi [Croceicoccus sp. F390]MDT0574823.1 DNA polymerase III subunit chi [Croceicoccus sp. F390]
MNGSGAMRVDFYHLTRDPAPVAIAEIARKALAAGHRMLVVSDDKAQRRAISDALWQAEGFLAHGEAACPEAGDGGAGDHKAANDHDGEAATDARQSLLIAGDTRAVNNASVVVFADGIWREDAVRFTRALLFFDESRIAAARQCWSLLKRQQDGELHYWKQAQNGWKEGP